MTMPRLLGSEATLNLVKDKFIKENDNIEVLEQHIYKSKSGPFPSLKTESFIFYKNHETNLLNVAQTQNLLIVNKFTIDEFKANLELLQEREKDRLLQILNNVGSTKDISIKSPKNK